MCQGVVKWPKGRQAVGGSGKKNKPSYQPPAAECWLFSIIHSFELSQMCFLRRLSCYVFFPLLELTTFFHARGWGSRALEWGPGRLPDSLDAQTQCFHPLFSKNRLLNCAWSLVSDEQKWKSQSSGRSLQAVHQSLVFAYSSKYEDVFWITCFRILYIYFIRSSLQFIKIWSPLSCILIYPLYQCAFKFLCHEVNIGQSHSFK